MFAKLEELCGGVSLGVTFSGTGLEGVARKGGIGEVVEAEEGERRERHIDYGGVTKSRRSGGSGSGGSGSGFRPKHVKQCLKKVDKRHSCKGTILNYLLTSLASRCTSVVYVDQNNVNKKKFENCSTYLDYVEFILLELILLILITSMTERRTESNIQV